MLLKAVGDNGQIWNASGTQDILDHLLDGMFVLLLGIRPLWKEFINAQIDRMSGDASDHYSYPRLQKGPESTPQEISV